MIFWKKSSLPINLKEKGYPILSKRYQNRIFRVERLNDIPTRATSFTDVVMTLAEKGVKWLEFSQLKYIPPSIGDVNSGLQAVGSYKDKMVIFETKVGVSTRSSGYIGWVGPREVPNEAFGLVYSSSGAALQGILNKLSKEVKHGI